jgi:serine/threonine-protein kinase
MTSRPLLAGRYELVHEIGRGATAGVWRAWDRRRRRAVAVKVLAAGADPTALHRFVREQRLRIDHPHVLTPIGWAADDEAALMVTELVRGGSLLDLVREAGRLPEPYVGAVLDQLLQALDAVHAQGVVHGDVKPANLLLDPADGGRPRLRLADFGVATILDEPVRFVTCGAVGTPAYLAPEAAERGPHPGQDVYAAGVLTRRLLDRPGPLVTLADSMSRPDAVRRPTAAEALARLRSLPVPRTGPWPVVPDRLGPVRRRR